MASPRARLRSTGLLLSMVCAVVGIAALAWWDARREEDAALEQFAAEQVALAQSVANNLALRLSQSPADPFSDARALETAGERVILFAPPPGGRLVSTSGQPVEGGPLAVALAGADPSLRLARPDAARLALPERMAVAGLARVDAGPRGRWGVAVAATAHHERDRQARAKSRLLLAVLLAAGLVVAFGGLALRRQRKALELERELAVAAVARDRDARLERVSRAATMLTLASGMAHELSTPLGAIVGRAEQLQPRVAGDERAARALQTILDQAERINQIVRGFLNLARGGALSLTPVEPTALAQGAVSLVEHRFAKRAVRLDVALPAQLPAVPCDARLLEQALVNLLLNACDACAEGGRVQLGATAQDGAVTFTVTDDGPGISTEIAARVTEPFFTTKPAGQGTGLGLAVTSEIMKSHRGALSLAPAVPHGTRATLRLPITDGGSNVRA